MNLEKLNLVELNEQEMKSIEGGNFLRRIWRWIKSHFVADIVETPEGPGAVGGVSFEF